jgi:hypothetical protein
MRGRTNTHTDLAENTYNIYSTYAERKALTDVQIDAYNVYACVKAMAEDGEDITAESISKEAGVCVDDTNRKCKAYIDVAVDMDSDGYVTYYKYYDIGSDICIYLDLDSYEWEVSSYKLSYTSIEIDD